MRRGSADRKAIVVPGRPIRQAPFVELGLVILRLGRFPTNPKKLSFRSPAPQPDVAARQLHVEKSYG